MVSYIIIGGFRPEQFFPNVEKNTPTTYILTNIYILETMPPPIFNALSVASLREAKKRSLTEFKIIIMILLKMNHEIDVRFQKISILKYCLFYP